jgi:carbamate kinase
MLPKVQACIGFIESGGREAFITCPEAMADVFEGRSGTRIVA